MLSGSEAFGAGLGGLVEALARNRGAALIALGAVGLLCLAFLSLRTRPLRYRRGRFLSQNEKRFLCALDEAVGEDYRVFAQVRLADLVDVDAGPREARRWRAMRPVFGKSVDFLICAAATLEPAAAIEVDDRTHLLPYRRERDVFVNTVFAEIGVPLLRVGARGGYSVAGLRRMLVDAGVDCRATWRKAEAMVRR